MNEFNRAELMVVQPFKTDNPHWSPEPSKKNGALPKSQKNRIIIYNKV